MNSTLNIYTQHFGLTERPFSLVPDPAFVYWSGTHTRAYTILEFGLLTRAPITLVTGDVGTGKTTLVHHLLNSMSSEVRAGLVANAHGDRSELLRWVLLAFGIPAGPHESYVDHFARFQDFLISEYAQGRRVVLIFDEAQNLAVYSLEELRMLTNINANKDELLQLILVGQPELRAVVQRPEMTQFAQRISSAYHLSPMDAETVQRYVDHRLQVVGAASPIFTPDACALVHQKTGGVPRLVNKLCDLSMVYAFTKGEYQVSRETVDQVVNDGVYFAVGPGLMPGQDAAEPPAEFRRVRTPLNGWTE
jgi:type II secretory pathway predicted ATPase ExeA